MKNRILYSIFGAGCVLITIFTIMTKNGWNHYSDQTKALESMGRGGWMESVIRSDDKTAIYDGLQRSDFSQFKALKPRHTTYAGIFHKGYDVSKGRDRCDCIAILVPEMVPNWLSLSLPGGNKCIALYSNGSASTVNFSSVNVINLMDGKDYESIKNRPTSRFSGAFDKRRPSIRDRWLGPLILVVGRINIIVYR